MTSTVVKPGLTSQTTAGGVGVQVIPPGTGGGVITNPAVDQGLTFIEPLFVSLVSPNPTLFENNVTTRVWPGQSFNVPANLSSGVYVSTPSPGHLFTAYYLGPGSNYPPTPVPGTFPPAAPTTMTQVIPSFLYQEYNDDDDLQAFVASQNQLTQTFINTINGLNLPIYTGGVVSGALLDWVGAGLYGIPRPTLSSYQYSLVGPFNTYQFNTVELNGSYFNSPDAIQVVTDDTYRRVLTWALLKGDGKVVNIRWLKRRIMQFLTGTNGVPINPAVTYQVSITFGPNNEAAIKFIDQLTTAGFGAIFNGFGFNTAQFNELELVITPLVPLPYRDIFQEAVRAAVLELPFQFNWNVYV